jgi:hypothetical protein
VRVCKATHREWDQGEPFPARVAQEEVHKASEQVVLQKGLHVQVGPQARQPATCTLTTVSNLDALNRKLGAAAPCRWVTRALACVCR